MNMKLEFKFRETDPLSKLVLGTHPCVCVEEDRALKEEQTQLPVF